ncbi:YdeI/OmpD-associated family protein [Rhodoferax sp.]|uniref:YdeI/OmpD-associated family protein n=1 Tax=Rhodoferax sp. TaxID=50421 RepID=UPI0025E2EC2B|nr:YdeI/OmpD-associated family protein [Rhodoferax sp.]
MSDKVLHTFETPEQLHTWLQAHHASEPELWVRIYKKGSGLPSVTWDDCVVAARADGRWARATAYAGSATMEIPEDFLAALQQHPAALAFYATLKRQQLFTIYYRLTSAKRAETRQKRIVEFLEKLGRGESL